MAAHERKCFADGCALSEDQFGVFNVATDALIDFDVTGFDAVVIGGSGDFSLVEGGFDWHQDILTLVRRLIGVGIPTFGSCFGFQAIVQAMGGELDNRDAHSEVGTFSIELTEAAGSDPIFGDLPTQFDAQLGHNDSAVMLPDGLTHLARSACCEYQAVKVGELPIIATQFHPELTREGSLARFRNYVENYKPPEHDVEDAMAYARQMHRPSPHASSLLPSFIDEVRRRCSVAAAL